jgi:hypothetical protein
VTGFCSHQIDLSGPFKSIGFFSLETINLSKFNGLGAGTISAVPPLDWLVDKSKEASAMKKLSTIAILTAAATFALTTSSFSGAVPRNDGAAAGQTQAVDQETISKLEDAANKALVEGRTGNKNNLEFRRKNYEINLLIDRLQSGQKVDPSEIDQALEPVHVW